ncbi:MAG: hypothetical protein Q4F15_02090 [Bacillota bacterium]|nr:hypothetical protein [Bacillota bacterium]
MNDCETLFRQGRYDELLELCSGKNDPKDIFYCLAAYTAKGEAEKALNLLLANRESLWKEDPIRTMKSDFELRFALKMFDEAYQDEEYFSNLPYVSQEVEETLRGLKGYIRANERAEYSRAEVGEGQLLKDLNSPDDFTVLQALGRLKPEHRYLSDKVREIALSKRNDSVRSFALLVLLSFNDKTPIDFEKKGAVHHLVPGELEPPYTGEIYQKDVSTLSSITRDTSLNQIAKSLYDQYVIEIFPEVEPSENKPLLLAGLSLLSASYLEAEADISEYLNAHNLTRLEAQKKADEIKKCLEDGQPLTF